MAYMVVELVVVDYMASVLAAVVCMDLVAFV